MHGVSREVCAVWALRQRPWGRLLRRIFFLSRTCRRCRTARRRGLRSRRSCLSGHRRSSLSGVSQNRRSRRDGQSQSSQSPRRGSESRRRSRQRGLTHHTSRSGPTLIHQSRRSGRRSCRNDRRQNHRTAHILHRRSRPSGHSQSQPLARLQRNWEGRLAGPRRSPPFRPPLLSSEAGRKVNGSQKSDNPVRE